MNLDPNMIAEIAAEVIARMKSKTPMQQAASDCSDNKDAEPCCDECGHGHICESELPLLTGYITEAKLVRLAPSQAIKICPLAKLTAAAKDWLKDNSIKIIVNDGLTQAKENKRYYYTNGDFAPHGILAEFNVKHLKAKRCKYAALELAKDPDSCAVVFSDQPHLALFEFSRQGIPATLADSATALEDAHYQTGVRVLICPPHYRGRHLLHTFFRLQGVAA